MITYRVRGVALMNSMLLSIAAAVLFWLWVFFHFVILRQQAGINADRYVIYCFTVMAAFGVDFIVARLHGTDLVQLDLLGALRVSLRQAATVLVCLLVFLVAAHDLGISRLFLFSFIPALCPLLLVLNRNLPRYLTNFFFHKKRRQRTLLVGTQEQARNLAGWLRHKTSYGVDIVGLLSPEAATEAETPLPILGAISDLQRVVRETEATQVICLQLPNAISRSARIATVCEKLGVRLLLVNDIEQRFKRPVYFFEDSGVRFVSLREEPLECPLNRVLKRVLDIAVALPVVTCFLPPLALAVWIFHRLQSPGPLFFHQRRTGFQFRHFEICKFRTMHVSSADEAAQAVRNDPRVFEFGRWLRRLSLDELPQFINVLRGEMSVVGPRPHMLEHDDLFEKAAQAYRIRSFVKPGITGLAQVKGFRGEARHDQDVVERVQSDVYYLEHWSFSLDWAIMLRTGWQMLRPPSSAY